MEKKIREKRALLEVLAGLEKSLQAQVERNQAVINDTDLTPDEDGWVADWKVERVDDSKACLAAIESVRAVLAKMI